MAGRRLCTYRANGFDGKVLRRWACNANAYCNRDSYSHAHSYANCDSNSYAYAQRYAYCDGNSNSHSDSITNSYANRNSKHYAEVYSNPATATDTTASPVGRACAEC